MIIKTKRNGIEISLKKNKSVLHYIYISYDYTGAWNCYTRDKLDDSISVGYSSDYYSAGRIESYID